MAYEALLQHVNCAQYVLGKDEAFRLRAGLSLVVKAAHSRTILQLFFHEHQQDTPRMLPDALWFLRSLFATDQRDKIYAALGLLKEAPLIIPDYEQDMETRT
jgi:hypothetical protein